MSKAKGCLKFGCLGCAGLFLVVLLVSGGIAAIGLMQGSSASMQQESLSQAVPHIDIPEPVGGEGVDPSQLTQDEVPPIFRAAGLADSTPGRVEIRFRVGRLEVEPGRPGEPIRVEADYDESRFRLKQEFSDDRGDGWVYKVTFAPKSWFRMFGEIDDPRVRIFLPPDTPFELVSDVAMGESEIELGGLWLTSVNLDAGMGEHRIRFDEPLMAPMEGFTLDGSMGEVSIRDLGNASPKQVDVSFSMGQMSLDLDGPWARDAEIEASCGMGECSVSVPEGVFVDVRKASIALGEKSLRGLRDRRDPPPGSPTLHLSVSHSMGELRIDGR